MIRIAIVDPQPAVRAGLSMLLRTEPGLVPVGAATGFDDGLELVARLRPDIVLVEHHLPDGDGIALCRRLGALPRPPQVILHTAEPAPELALLARVASADGLVDKLADPEELFEAIRLVVTAAPARSRRSTRGRWTPRPTWSTPRTCRCSRCSPTGPRRARRPTRCTWIAAARRAASSGCSGGSGPARTPRPDVTS